MTQIIRDTTEGLERASTETYLFPASYSRDTNGVYLKVRDSLSVLSDISTFWATGFSGSIMSNPALIGAYTPITTTTRTTILDVLDKGTLTTVISPELAASNHRVTIWVTIDGVEQHWYAKIYTGDRLLLGGFEQGIIPVTSTVNDGKNGAGGPNDSGYYTIPPTLLLNPYQAIYKGVGIPFNTSLKVEVQLHDAGNPTAYHNNAGVIYVKTY